MTQEVRTAFKSVDEIDINSVNKLTYMLAVLNETLRLYPPVTSNLPRVVPRGGAKVLGEYIPEGVSNACLIQTTCLHRGRILTESDLKTQTIVEVQSWSMNHSKENWVDPWAFNPARFLDDKETAREKGNILDSLQAFSVGPRNCIGRK